MKPQNTENLLKYSVIILIVLTIIGFGITIISGNHKITDIAAVVGTIGLLGIAFIVIVYSLYREFTNIWARFSIITVALLIILGIAYIVILN